MKKSVNGLCPNCGSENLTYAVDMTHYNDVEFIEGKFQVSNTTIQAMAPFGEGHVPERFFCCDCGEDAEVPEELS